MFEERIDKRVLCQKRSIERRYVYSFYVSSFPEKFGVKLGSKKHLYFIGFFDAISGFDTAQEKTHNCLKELSWTYFLGYAFGKRASYKYFEITGNQLLKYEI